MFRPHLRRHIPNRARKVTNGLAFDALTLFFRPILGQKIGINTAQTAPDAVCGRRNDAKTLA